MVIRVTLNHTAFSVLDGGRKNGIKIGFDDRVTQIEIAKENIVQIPRDAVR